MRNVFASLLFLGALLMGLVGSVLHWGDYVARSPEPTVRLAQSIMHDEAVINAISDQLQSAVDKHSRRSRSRSPGCGTACRSWSNACRRGHERRPGPRPPGRACLDETVAPWSRT